MLPSKLITGGGEVGQRGYSLLEALVILAVVAIATGVVLWQWRTAQSQGTATSAAYQEAQQMVTLGNAAYRYGQSKSASLAKGAVFNADPATLVAAGQLSATFGSSSTPGITPLGMSYKASGMKDAITGGIEVAVWTTGAPTKRTVAALGLAQSDVGLAAFANQVMANLTVLAKAPNALIYSGATSATEVSGGFSIDLSGFFPAAATQTTPVLLMGYSILGQASSIPPPSQVNPGNCNVLIPNSATQLPSCPSGFTQMGQWPVCGKMNSYVSLPYSIYGTQAGDIVVGQVYSMWERHDLDCWFGPFAPYCKGNYAPVDQEIDVITLVNGARVNTDKNCGGYTWTVISNTMQQQPRVNPLVNNYQSNSIEQLCCKSQ